jgi:O-antigen/teichoic acid export membrane protein
MAGETEESGGSVLSVLAKGSGVVFFGLILELGFRLFGKVFVARMLGQVDFGTVALAMTLTGVTASIMTVGMNSGVARYIPRGEGEKHHRGVLVSGFGIAIPLSVALGAAVFALAEPFAGFFDASAAASAFRAAGVAIPFAVTVKMAIGAMRGEKLTRPVVILKSVVVPAGRFACFVGAVLLGARAVGVTWAYALSFGLAALLGVYYLYRYTPLFGRTSPEWMHGELLSYSVPVMVRNVMTMVLVHIDTFLVGAIATVAAVGVYNAVYPLAALVTLAHKATNFLYLPLVSELDAEEDTAEIRTVYRTVAKWLFLATVPVFVAVAVFPNAVITLTYGPEYVEGARALTVLSVGFFVHTVVGVNGGTLEAIGETRFVMVASAVTAVLNVALNLLLIPDYSLLGAAVATSVCYVVLNVLYTGYLYRVTGLMPFNRRLGYAAAGVGVLLVGVFALKGAVGNGVTASLALGFGFLGPYAAVAARYGVGEEDLAIVEELEGEMGVDLSALKRAVRALAA